MSKEEILREIENAMVEFQEKKLKTLVESFLQTTEEEEASRALAFRLYRIYTSLRADAIAKLMEIILRTKRRLGMTEFPENPFFQICVLAGSKDLYDCYVEEIIDPFLASNKEEDIANDVWISLVSVGNKIHEDVFKNYTPIIRGLHFSGPFGSVDGSPGATNIHREDFEIMNGVVEKYNAILGRRDILKDLNKRFEEC